MEQKQRSMRSYLSIGGKGMMMGAADAVPGVSGGTVAFITGIYEELIHSLRQVDLSAAKILFSDGPKAFWAHINGSFLLALVGGIIFSLASFAHLIVYLLDTYPEMLWSFFFGLILASTWSVMRHIPRWDMNTLSFFILGTLSAYVITSISPTQIEATSLMIFLAGSIAICAMILPGISGSFILLIMGLYGPILGAVKSFDLPVILLFMSGCVVGLLSFVRVLDWLFSNYKALTLAVLSGFLLGSLNKVWPWKYTTAYTVDRHGKEVPLVQDNISPFAYEALTGQNSFMVASLVLLIVGMALVLLLDSRDTQSG
ncbi:DUF368 domain-containing protein [Neptunomonas sp. XY-337]|uniref:DUF368 domain-containing protein n=1 Tax=Neptunomonas sp. XY-337 TaxID=2561897 RepID=UPI001F118C94|nr:DUF368 domain-containing protein [Neptunomonas sp. XY-337]